MRAFASAEFAHIIGVNLGIFDIIGFNDANGVNEARGFYCGALICFAAECSAVMIDLDVLF